MHAYCSSSTPGSLYLTCLLRPTLIVLTYPAIGCSILYMLFSGYLGSGLMTQSQCVLDLDYLDDVTTISRKLVCGDS